jgi:hypothetical protein
MKQEVMKINNLSLFDLGDYSSDRCPGDYDWENSELDRMYEQPPPKVKPPLSCLPAWVSSMDGEPVRTDSAFRDGEPVGREPPPDTNAILKICQWFREQPNGGIVDLPEVREQIENLLPNLQPPILREHFKSLLPNLDNREQNREQENREQNRGQENREQTSWLTSEFPTGKILDNQPSPAGTRNREQSKTLLPIFKPHPENREQNREQIETDPTRSPLVQTEDDRQIITVNGVTYILQHTKSLKPINRLNGWLDVKPSANKRNLYLCLRWRDDGKQRSKHLGKVIRADAA